MESIEQSSGMASDHDTSGQHPDPIQGGLTVKTDVDMTSSLEEMQTEEQRQVLDIVAQIRKCGLDSILELPQLVVCGDQSAGKSSVLEALTEIPFPRNDNLCTRFATEIILRRAPSDSLTIKIIPDIKRPQSEQEKIKAFKESITDFYELPRIMNSAMAIMEVNDPTSASKPRAFAKDVLSVEIEGSSRPQLTLVDIPGLIQTDTKGVTKADVELVAEITDQYISQDRTICLAVVSAANDYANQRILTKVREVDPDGNRTIGIITKPDRLPSGSGTEKAFIALARNEDIFFKLGWHVLKNRTFEEGDASLDERNAAEAVYFRKSNFKDLPESSVGIDTLRTRLSQMLFDHVKHELPKLRSDLGEALASAKAQLSKLGEPRIQPSECKDYLSGISVNCSQICTAAVKGHYEGEYFNVDPDRYLSSQVPVPLRRLRAVVQFKNTDFASVMRIRGHKYQVELFNAPNTFDANGVDEAGDAEEAQLSDKNESILRVPKPVKLDREAAIAWVRGALVNTRGQELLGNFNPLLVGELLWEQCSKWKAIAEDHLMDVAAICNKFLQELLQDLCSNDVSSRLQACLIQDALQARYDGAAQELEKILLDTKSYPINYNHYYTDTIRKRRQERQKKSLEKSIESATEHSLLPDCNSDHTSASIDVEKVMALLSQSSDADMMNVSCEEALDCLYAIYKVTQKSFVANVTTQVIERHIVRGMQDIFSSHVVNNLKIADAVKIASEPTASKRQRQFLGDRIKKLEDGEKIFRAAMGSVSL